MNKLASRFLLVALMAATFSGAATTIAAEPPATAARSATALLDQAPEANGGLNDITKMEKDGPPIERNFAQQPPLIPHAIKNYNITRNFNRCLDCHAWSKAAEAGATKVSETHFRDRDGKVLDNISPRRYFCVQCHVPQSDAKPLVANTFQGIPRSAKNLQGATK